MSVSFNSFVFLDLESTGLPFRELDGRRTRITEICMISVRKEQLLKCGKPNYYPRVLHKLTLPINPCKIVSPDASHLSGLDNFLLENEEPFNEKITAVITSFLNTCSPPICLIAHNGYVFDFPLLKEEFKKFKNVIIPLDVYCSDSRIAFCELGRMRGVCSSLATVTVETPAKKNELDRSSIRLNPEITDVDLAFNEVANEIEQLYSPLKENSENKATDVIQRINETTPKIQLIDEPSTSCKLAGGERRRLFVDSADAKKFCPNERKISSLKDVYKHLFGDEFANQHEAESDVIALIKCCVKYGRTAVDWFECNHKLFDDVQPLYK